jgi:Lysozyme like domain/Fibronectin type III domain
VLETLAYRNAVGWALALTISVFLSSTPRRAQAACTGGTCITVTADQVAQAAYGAGFRGGALVNSIAVADAESGSQSGLFALNAIHANADGTMDYGLWQINSTHGYDPSQLLSSASYNASAAYQISNRGATWCPWTTFSNDAFANYLSNPGRTAAQKIDNSVILPPSQGASQIMATANVSVRARPGGSLLRTVSARTTGTVVDGPQTLAFGTCPNGKPYYYVWWKIHWTDGGIDGWSVEDALTRTGGAVITVPASPIVTAATNVSSSSFTANWNASQGATDYRIDVSTYSSFSVFSTIDIGSALSRTLTGLSTRTSYYYRVRAYNTAGGSANSNTITVTTR